MASLLYTIFILPLILLAKSFQGVIRAACFLGKKQLPLKTAGICYFKQYTDRTASDFSFLLIQGAVLMLLGGIFDKSITGFPREYSAPGKIEKCI